VDILEWDYEKAYPPEYFDLVAASPPCTAYSAVNTRGVRDYALADAIVLRTLEIIRYIQPKRWWIETPANRKLPRRPFPVGLPWVDVDYCQFEALGYQKPTRFFSSDRVGRLPSVRCDQHTCTTLKPVPDGEAPTRRAHTRCWGGKERGVDREQAYYIPPGVIECVAGLSAPPLQVCGVWAPPHFSQTRTALSPGIGRWGQPYWKTWSE
jgi:hypothetical protein